MRTDPETEKLHITEISDRLNQYRHLLCDEDDVFNVEVTSMLSAVEVYEALHRGVLPIFFGVDRLKECCHFVASAMDLVRYIDKISDQRKIRRIKEHLKLIGTGGFGIYATYQKQQSNDGFLYARLIKEKDSKPNKEAERDATRKSIELMLALAALNKFDDVILENPHQSSDDAPNPDLIVIDGKDRYGIACKSISSTNKSNFIGHVEYAIEQLKKSLEAKAIDQGRGIVFIDVSSLLDHDRLFMVDMNHYWPRHAAAPVLMHEIDQVLVKVIGLGDVHKKFSHLFKKSGVAPCVVIYAHSLMITGGENDEAPHYYKPMRVLPCGDHSKVTKFLTALNDANHCQ